MTDATRSGFVILAVLGVVGLSLAGVTSALGVTETAADDVGGEFVVFERNVTFSDGTRERTVVENLTNVTAIEITREEGRRFSVRAETGPPLSATDRERAKRIARTNETVRRALARLDGHDLSVEPIRELSTQDVVGVTVERSNESNWTNDSAETRTFTVTNVTSANESESVVVQRDPKYVPDRAAVEIRGPDSEHRYTVYVDLANRTVVDIGNWTSD